MTEETKQMKNTLCQVAISAFAVLITGTAMAQSAGTAGTGQSSPIVVTSPPSVDNGVANGVVKSAGSPSVNNGVSNGVVKRSGSPSVGDGIGNGVVKSSTIQQ